MLCDLRLQRRPLLAGKVLHKRHHRCHGVRTQHRACRGQRCRLCNGHARVQGQDGPGVVAPQPVQCPGDRGGTVPLGGLQVGQQVIDVVRRALAPLLFQDTIFQHLDAVLGLDAAVQHLLHIPDGCRQSGIGCRVPQAPLHHAAALLQQDGHLALDTVLQEAPALDGGIQLHALDLGCQRSLVHRNGVIVFHGGPLVAQQLHAGLVDQVRGVAAKKSLHVLAPGPVVVGHSLFHGLDHSVGHGVSRAVRQHPDLHGLAFLVGLLNVAPVVFLRIRDRQAAVQQVLPAVGVLQVHVQAAQLGVGQRCGPALAVLQANVHQLRPGACEFLHLLEVFPARHIVKELRPLHSDPGLFPLSVIQHGGQLLHLAARLVAAQHPEHTACPQHVQVVPGQGTPQLSIVALALAYLRSRLVGDLVHRFSFLQTQGLVCRPDHMQGAGRNGFQHPHLIHRQGQIGAVLGLPDPLSQPVTQHLGLFAVRQRLGLGQLLVQPVKLGLLAGIQVFLQCTQHICHAAPFPVLAHSTCNRFFFCAKFSPNTALQSGQAIYCRRIQNRHIRQLCHLCRLLDQVGLHIPVLAGPQDHLVQLGSIGPDTPPQLVLLPSVPGFLHPLLGQLLGNGNVLVPLLLGRSDGNCVSFRLLFLPFLGLALIFLLPFQQFVFLMDQLPLSPVSPALFSCHLVRKVPVLPLQLFVLQPDLVQHLLALFLQPLLFGLPLPFVGFLQHIQLFGHVAVVCDVQPQRIQILIQQLFCLFIPLLLFCPLPQCFIPASVPAVLVHPPVELPVLLLLHLPQVLQRLLRVLLTHGSGHGLALPALEPVKDGLCIGHLRHVQDITQHPVGQLHFGILVLGSICKAAHHPGLDGIVHVHQHIQPLGALHAGRAVHACRLGRAPEQGRCPFLGAAHGPGVVDDGFIHFRRVAVPHTLCLPQLHAVLPGLRHRFTPRPVPFHQLRLGLAVLVHRVAQVVVFRVLVPQLGVPVGGPAQYFIRNGLRQRAGLAHAGPVRRHVLHQRPGLSGNLRPVGPAAVGLCPPHRQPVNGILADPHTVGHTHHLGQRFHRRAVVRNGPACLPLGVLPRVPFRLFGQLETDVRHLVQQGRALGIVPGFVELHVNAGLFQAVDQGAAGVVGQDRRPHLIKAHGPLGLRFKVPGGNGSHALVQVQYHLGRVLANGVPLFCKGLANGCRRLFSLCGLHQDAAQNFPLFKAVVCMGRSLSPQLVKDIADLVICLFQQRLVLFLRHLLQAALVRPHFVQVLILRRGRAHQGAGCKPPGSLSTGILLVHGSHKVFQRVTVVQLGKTAPVAVPGVDIFAVVDSLLTQNLLHLRQDPFRHILIQCFFLYFLQHGIGIPHQFSALVLGYHVIISVIQQYQQLRGDYSLGLFLSLFFAPPELFHRPGLFCFPHLFQHGMGQVMVIIGPVSLNDVPQRFFTAHCFNGLFASPHL